MAAGVMQYPRKRFLSSLAAGRALRFFGIAWLGCIYGDRMIGFLAQYYRPMLYILISLAALAAVAAVVYFKGYRPRAQREQRERGEQVEQFPRPR